MAAPATYRSYRRGLRSVEQTDAGTLVYDVDFGDGAAQRAASGHRALSEPQPSFFDLEARRDRSLLVWLLVAAAHIGLMFIPFSAASDKARVAPPPPEGISVTLLPDRTARSGPQAVRAAGDGDRQPIADKPRAAVAASAGIANAADDRSAQPHALLGSAEAARSLADAARRRKGEAVAPSAGAGLGSNAPPDKQASVQAQRSPAEEQWEGALLARIAQKKKYPKAALAAGLQDVVMVRLFLDRRGKLVRAEIAKSRGHRALNDEVLALARRASPYPPPPETVLGEPVSLVVPVEFLIKPKN